MPSKDMSVPCGSLYKSMWCNWLHEWGGMLLSSHHNIHNHDIPVSGITSVSVIKKIGWGRDHYLRVAQKLSNKTSCKKSLSSSKIPINNACK